MAEDLTDTARPGRAAVVESSAPPASPPGYELIDEIGHGGMGVVYRARDTALNREVAVKLLSVQIVDADAGGLQSIVLGGKALPGTIDGDNNALFVQDGYVGG